MVVGIRGVLGQPVQLLVGVENIVEIEVVTIRNLLIMENNAHLMDPAIPHRKAAIQVIAQVP